jgi:hypothetical protein
MLEVWSQSFDNNTSGQNIGKHSKRNTLGQDEITISGKYSKRDRYQATFTIRDCFHIKSVMLWKGFTQPSLP